MVVVVDGLTVRSAFECCFDLDPGTVQYPPESVGFLRIFFNDPWKFSWDCDQGYASKKFTTEHLH